MTATSSPLAAGMCVALSSNVPRFPEGAVRERVIGPDTYNPHDPCAPPVMVHDRSRRTAAFQSALVQRPPIIAERTETFVAPGTYEPRYSAVMPDVSRNSQFAEKKSAIFMKQGGRFQPVAGSAASVESRWTLNVDSKEWTCNRNGGGCWSKARLHAMASTT